MPSPILPHRHEEDCPCHRGGSTLAALVPVAPIDPANTEYPWNFSPVLPLCGFGAACYAPRRAAYLAPFAIFRPLLFSRVAQRQPAPATPAIA